MTLQLEDLVERGYFPKELPPPFNTKDLAKNVSLILAQWQTIFENNTEIKNTSFVLTQNSGESKSDFKSRKNRHKDNFINKYNSSKLITYSISKGKSSRRLLQIPNPKHFILLSKEIIFYWPDIKAIYDLSPYSKSYPIPVPDKLPQKRSISTFIKMVGDFRNELLKASFDKMIEVRVDISKFYPTIYTHSVAWALLGKEEAKHYFKYKSNLEHLIKSGDPDAILYKHGEDIDTALRACQEKQSKGLPIGPDTSHIIAELIACRIDKILSEKYKNIDLKACRYYDDYYLYVSSMGEAEQILKGLQLILSEFQLEINESKIKIRKYPFAYEDDFVTALFHFSFKKTNLNNSLKHYFSLVWSFVEKEPERSDWILKYALKNFEYMSVNIPKDSWQLFEDLLLKTALIEPATLDIIARILWTYKSYLDQSSKTKLARIINLIVNDHCGLNHNFEVAWALWIAKMFEVNIQEKIANKVISTLDNVSNLILLDMIKTTALVEGNPNIQELEQVLTDDVFFSECWLLGYEGIKKGWLTPLNSNLIDDNHFFKLLRDNNVEFYDTKRQMNLFEIQQSIQSGKENTPPRYGISEFM